MAGATRLKYSTNSRPRETNKMCLYMRTVALRGPRVFRVFHDISACDHISRWKTQMMISCVHVRHVSINCELNTALRRTSWLDGRWWWRLWARGKCRDRLGVFHASAALSQLDTAQRTHRGSEYNTHTTRQTQRIMLNKMSIRESDVLREPQSCQW